MIIPLIILQQKQTERTLIMFMRFEPIPPTARAPRLTERQEYRLAHERLGRREKKTPTRKWVKLVLVLELSSSFN